MCKIGELWSLKCDCVRCNFADILDPQQSGWYPHYGTNIVGDEDGRGYSWAVVKPEDRCSSAIIDDNEDWKGCHSRQPKVFTLQTAWCGKEGGLRYCDDCKKDCVSLRAEEASGGLGELELSDTDNWETEEGSGSKEDDEKKEWGK
jgi:hypothetical protein